MGVDRLIHLSAMNVTPDPIPKVYKGGSKWLKSKYWGEQAVMEEFPNATIIRPADMYGREDHFFWYYSHIWRHQWHWMPLWEKGEKTVKAPVFGGDVAQAIVNAAKDPESAGKIYQGVGPQRYLLSEIVDYMHRVMQKDEKDWGYKRYDMKYDPTFWLRTYLTDKFQISHPIGELHRERVEREYIDDVILDGVPTLEDLGVTPSLIEENVSYIIVFFIYFKLKNGQNIDIRFFSSSNYEFCYKFFVLILFQAPFELKQYSAFLYYTPEPGEFPVPGKPKPLGKFEFV